jgi:hypothetical protein
MNHYQQGFLAGLNEEPTINNPLQLMVNEFDAGVNAKNTKKVFSERSFCENSLTFREGYKSSGFAHLASKGLMLKVGCKDWTLGHKSGVNKFNNVLDGDVHNVAFNIDVETNAVNKDVYTPFVQFYTYLDHQNEVYSIEARHRHGLTSCYPNYHIINRSPCLPEKIKISELESTLGQTILITTHDILQISYRGYHPLTIQGINFLTKSFQGYMKLALNIPQWNEEAKKQVTWRLDQPTFA